jgi:hypothetical protein
LVLHPEEGKRAAPHARSNAEYIRRARWRTPFIAIFLPNARLATAERSSIEPHQASVLSSRPPSWLLVDLNVQNERHGGDVESSGI